MDKKDAVEECVDLLQKDLREPGEYAFWMALPDFFKTVPQQCVLSQHLWNDEGTAQLVIHMRVYDILRRLYYVRSGETPRPSEVLKCMRLVMSNMELREFILGYARAGKFPDTTGWKLLNDR